MICKKAKNAFTLFYAIYLGNPGIAEKGRSKLIIKIYIIFWIVWGAGLKCQTGSIQPPGRSLFMSGICQAEFYFNLSHHRGLHISGPHWMDLGFGPSTSLFDQRSILHLKDVQEPSGPRSSRWSHSLAAGMTFISQSHCVVNRRGGST